MVQPKKSKLSTFQDNDDLELHISGPNDQASGPTNEDTNLAPSYLRMIYLSYNWTYKKDLVQVLFLLYSSSP